MRDRLDRLEETLAASRDFVDFCFCFCGAGAGAEEVGSFFEEPDLDMLDLGAADREETDFLEEVTLDETVGASMGVLLPATGSFDPRFMSFSASLPLQRGGSEHVSKTVVASTL